ncbi:MAG: 7,8-didemethyl-8-hydroxy-5-deazariboflavin synthase CofG subunit [Candidatus Nitrosomirales archaeon]
MLSQEVLDHVLLGREIRREEAYALMHCNADQLCELAYRIRKDAKGSLVTYSRKVFIPLTNLCRDTCSYCTYKREPTDPRGIMMKPEQVLQVAEGGKKAKCTEALFMTGERPEQKYDEARQWLKSLGYSGTLEYIIQMSELVLKKTGLFPHTNPGNMTTEEMLALKQSNPSLGMMLENVSERLCGKDMPHELAPSKNPKVRLKTIENAGKLKIPFTTGLLVGMGETPYELVDSLFAIKELHAKYGHIQEVIIQNFSPKPDTPMACAPTPTLNYMLKAVAVARVIMPSMNIQVPPNLNPSHYGKYLDAGINDWGGISPVTIDHVNPEFAWPRIDDVKSATERKGFVFRARLPVYPKYINKEFLSDNVMDHVEAIADAQGLVKEEYLRD